MKESFDNLLEYLTYLNIYVRHTKRQLEIQDAYDAVEWQYTSPYVFVEIETGDIELLNEDDPEIEELKNNPSYLCTQQETKDYNYKIIENKINGLVRLQLEATFTDIEATIKEKTNKFINDFDNSFLAINENSQQNTIKLVKQRLQNKLSQEAKLFKYYPICKAPIKKIEKHLKNTWDIDLELNYDIDYVENNIVGGLEIAPPIWSDYVSRFKEKYGEDTLKFNTDKVEDKTEEIRPNNIPNLLRLKRDIKPKPNVVLRQIYNIFADYDIIDTEVEVESFISALSEYNTNDRITFSCSTPLAVNLIEEIKVLFVRFNAKKVENSKIFYTKDGCLLTQTNYNKAKGEIDESDTIQLNKVKKVLKPIISSAIK